MEKEKISSETIARTIVLAIALLNQVLDVTGKAPLNLSENDIYSFVSLSFTIIASILAFWKNNSFTSSAIKADRTKKYLKEKGE